MCLYRITNFKEQMKMDRIHPPDPMKKDTENTMVQTIIISMYISILNLPAGA